jgi:hypothetical protein
MNKRGEDNVIMGWRLVYNQERIPEGNDGIFLWINNLLNDSYVNFR